MKNEEQELCERCKKNPIALFASQNYIAINKTKLCSECLLDDYKKSAYVYTYTET